MNIADKMHSRYRQYGYLFGYRTGGVRHKNNCYTLQTATFAFHRVVWLRYSGEVGKFVIFCVKFRPDIVHLKLSKSTQFLKRGCCFEHVLYGYV